MTCPIDLGRNARIKLDTTTVARMTSFDLNINNETIDITSFGDDWAKFCRGMQSWTASITGNIDRDDVSQESLNDAAEAGTLITNLRIYTDTTAYFASNLVEDSEAGMYITGYTVTGDNNSVVTFTMNITGNGPVAKYP